MFERRLVLLESPFAGNVARNIAYGRACMRHSLEQGESPIASHLLYTQPGVLRDEWPAERLLGLEAGLAWLTVVEASVVYTNFGISPGMQKGIDRAVELGLPVEYRKIDFKS